MRLIITVLTLLFAQCTGPTKSSSTNVSADSTTVTPSYSDGETGNVPKNTSVKNDTIPHQGRNIDLVNGKVLDKNIPSCLVSYTRKIMEDEVKNPATKIYSYLYKGKKVFYVTAPCCDFFSDLLDADCNLIGHPDGGITGRGDGKMPDFHKSRTDEKLVWEDPRLPR